MGGRYHLHRSAFLSISGTWPGNLGFVASLAPIPQVAPCQAFATSRNGSNLAFRPAGRPVARCRPDSLPPGLALFPGT